MAFDTVVMICPCCKTYMDKAMPVTGVNAPKNGDFSICANCATILCFVIKENNISYRKAGDEDFTIAKIQGVYPDLISAQKYILSGNHSFRNMTKEEIDSTKQKHNW